MSTVPCPEMDERFNGDGSANKARRGPCSGTLGRRRRGVGEGHVVAARGHRDADVVDDELGQAIPHGRITNVSRGPVTEAWHKQCNTHGEHNEESERPANTMECVVALGEPGDSARCHGGAESTPDLRHRARIGRVDAIDISANFVQLVTHFGHSPATGFCCSGSTYMLYCPSVARSSLSFRLARDRRDRTVPTLIPRARAMSS